MLFYREDKMPENWEMEWDNNKNGVADFFENWNDLYAYSKYLRDTDASQNKDSQYGFMSSFNDLYLNGQFLLSYGAYVFAENEDELLNVLETKIAALLAEHEFAEMFYENYEEMIPEIIDDENWCFSDSGLTVIVNPYMIAPYAVGALELTVPYGELDGIIEYKWWPIV